MFQVLSSSQQCKFKDPNDLFNDVHKIYKWNFFQPFAPWFLRRSPFLHSRKSSVIPASKKPSDTSHLSPKIWIHLRNISCMLYCKLWHLSFSGFGYWFQKKSPGKYSPYIYRPSVINCSTIFDATTPIHSQHTYVYTSVHFYPVPPVKRIPRVISVVIVFTRNRIRKIFTKDNFEFSICSYHLHLCKQF